MSDKQIWKDHSVFQGITQYYDEYGQEWQRVNEDFHYAFYKFVDDAWVFQTNMTKRGKGIKTVHKAMLRLETFYVIL